MPSIQGGEVGAKRGTHRRFDLAILTRYATATLRRSRARPARSPGRCGSFSIVLVVSLFTLEAGRFLWWEWWPASTYLGTARIATARLGPNIATESERRAVPKRPVPACLPCSARAT